MPVGGSVSATALIVNSGARTRVANIFAGVVIALISLLFAGAVGRLAMPALAGLLIVIGFRTLKPAAVMSVWRTGDIQRVVLVITFVLVLVVPLQYAVLSGVALSILLYVVRQSNRVVIREWKVEEGKLPIEQSPEAYGSSPKRDTVGSLWGACSTLRPLSLRASCQPSMHRPGTRW